MRTNKTLHVISMVTYAIRKILRETIDAKLSRELQGYSSEQWADGQETQMLKYDGAAITYYKRKRDDKNPMKRCESSSDQEASRR